jgi:oligosaccharide repeat unit polymerase
LIRERKDTVVKALRIIIVPLVIFSALFIGIVFLEKDLSGFDGDVSAIFSNYTVAYLVAPLAALDYVLRHPAEYLHAANHTFEFLLKGLDALGYPYKIPPTFDEYLFVPYPANIYTIYKPYFLDFGMFGMFGTIATFGFSQTFIYGRAISGRKVSQFMFSLSIFPIVFSIFDDAYSEFVLLFMAFCVAVIYFGFLNRLKLGFSIPRLTFWSRSLDQGGRNL